MAVNLSCVVARFAFDPGSVHGQDMRTLAGLTRKVRDRFPVSCAPWGDPERDGEFGLVITSVGDSEERLSKMIDAIARFCEESGFGRVDGESSMLAAVDELLDDS